MDYHKSLVYSVFRHLPAQQIDAITAQLETVEYESGATIVRQGAPADKFFIIVDGEVTVLRDSGQGEVPVATLGRGQFFGEIAILQDTPRTATARATSPVTLLTMDRSIFRSLVAQSLSTTQDFDRLIRERLTALGRQTGRP
jgi:CRP-like cAMP-binding protein